ncbi:hypothetical protein D5018_07030 [Parashewanella curva]|uniref:VUT family protein n=1 Tax=Parashewanella curva TaxID=2338552 RepID=A0A3L8PYI6_9GAMM|nr:VUT family protein [Parashewanella curva]RLV60404.1 hypothetical protein D5018_07030 [Parashewanella curva]
MATASEYQKMLRTTKLNYILIGLLITTSITSHLIANRFIVLFGYPVIPATFTYMLVFSLSDMLAALNNRRFVVWVLVGEALANSYWLMAATGVDISPAPDFFPLAQSYHDVFGSVPELFLANLGGGLIIGIIDILLFSHWYQVKQYPYFKSTLFSTLVSISAYTYFTDYFGFKGNYPESVFLLAHVNIVTNVLCVIVYSILSTLAMKAIREYISTNQPTAGVQAHDPV